MDSSIRRTSKGASLTSVYRLDTGLLQNAPNASLNPKLWMLSSCCKSVFDSVPYTMQPQSSLERTMARYSIRSVSLSLPQFKWATTRMWLRASMHCFFSTLMCFFNERCESHHSLRNFIDSSGRSVLPILTAEGLWALDRGAVKCMTAIVDCKLETIPSRTFTACWKCLYMVSTVSPRKQIAR